MCCACRRGAAALALDPVHRSRRRAHVVARAHEPDEYAANAVDGVAMFRGIRYGADTRNTAIQPPDAPEPWHEVVDALEYGPASRSPGSTEKTSEDCLFLNVWTPSSGDAARRPVLVYIHGGAYASGLGFEPALRRRASRGSAATSSS